MIMPSTAALWLLGGCAGYYMMNAAKDRAVVDLSCERTKIEVADVGAGAYRATGCGGIATYVCTGRTCIKESMEEQPRVSSAPESSSESPIPGADSGEGETEDDDEVKAAKEALRGAIDERREDILACVGSERAAVVAEAMPDGAVVLSLQGKLSSSPQEECLRGAVSDLRTEPRESGFTVVHLVR